MATRKKTDYLSDEVEAPSDRKPSKRSCGSVEKSCKASNQQLAEIMTDNLHWFNYAPVKTDEECVDRLVEFFQYYADNGGIPTVEKMCLALGVAIQRVWEWQNGAKGDERAEIVKRAKNLIASFDADLAIRGLINPVVYIFRGKNYYGMKDQQEVSVTHTARIEDGMSQDEIRRRLLEDSSSTITELSTATEPSTIEVTAEVDD